MVDRDLFCCLGAIGSRFAFWQDDRDPFCLMVFDWDPIFCWEGGNRYSLSLWVDRDALCSLRRGGYQELLC